MKKIRLIPSRLLALVVCIGFTPLFAQSVAPTAQPPVSTIPSDEHYTTRPEYRTEWEDYQVTMSGRTVDVVFIGDSITQQWRWGQGKPVWEQHYAARALNFGQGGDLTQHTLWRLRNLDVRKYHPKIAVVMIGTNNFKDTAENIAAGAKAVIETTREVFGGVKVIFVSILPSKRAAELMQKANTLIAPLADGRSIYFLDVAAKFQREGDLWSLLQRDQLHLTRQAYEVWAAALDPLLAQLLATPTAAAHESVSSTKNPNPRGEPLVGFSKWGKF